MWEWLANNKDALGALTAIGGVVVGLAGVAVAAVYAWLTHRLADTAQRQTRLTEQTFEASHRPYVQLWMDDASYADADHFRFRFGLKNHGAVPAVRLRWSVTIRDKAGKVLVEADSGVPRMVFPGEESSFEVKQFKTSGFTSNPPQGLRVEAIVDYRGASKHDYSARFVGERQDREWRVLLNEIV